MQTIVQEVLYALRRLGRSPIFTITSVLTLALGIGATTSIFTLVNAVMFKSLPVASPKELFRLGRESRCCYQGGFSQEKEFSIVSYDLYKYLRDNTKGFSHLAAFQAFEPLFGVRRSGSTEAAQSYPGEFVSGNYFATFGINAYAGRLFSDVDDQVAAAPVAIMSYRLWREKYGSDPAVIDSVFTIDRKPFTVVGITPPGFFGDSLRVSPPDFFLPHATEPLIEADADLYKYNTHWLDLIGRIRPNVASVSVEAEMRVALKQWLQSHWGEMSANDRARFPEQTLYLSPGGAGISSMREQYEHWLQVLVIVSGFALLIVCANVANLMLVRSMERRRQTALSIALGAGTSRVVRPALTESLMLSFLGGALGLAIASIGTRLILYFAFPSTPGSASIPIDASLSVPMLLFAMVTSLLTGVAFGVAPAWIATRVDPIEALRGSGHSTVRVGTFQRKTLVVLQAAFSLALLSLSGILTISLQRLENLDFGFDQDRRTIVNINPRLAGYRTQQLPSLYRGIHDSIANLPGVSSVALCLYSPQAGPGWGSGVWVDGHPLPGPEDDNSASWDRVTAGYFQVIGNPIVNGRAITEQDTASSQHVAVINEAFAKKFFSNEDPIGKHFGRKEGATRQFEVIGVAKDARYLTTNVDKPIEPFFFLPEAQAEYTGGNQGSLFLHDIVIHTNPGVYLSIAEIRQAMTSVDPDLPVISVRNLRDQVATQFSQQRVIIHLTSYFGILSLILASIGLYGVTAYNAANRSNEIGVRMALGATRTSVTTLILRDTLLLIGCGLFLGMGLTLAVIQLLKGQVYGLGGSGQEGVITVMAVGVFMMCALIAALVPARRASSRTPTELLRIE